MPPDEDDAVIDAFRRIARPDSLLLLAPRKPEQFDIVAKKLEQGHDRLLELNSCKPEQAAELVRQIRSLDGDEKFEEFFIRVLDHLA